MRDILKASMVQVNAIPSFAKASDIYFYDPESRKLVMVGDTEVCLIEGDAYYIQQANSDKHYTVSAKELHKKAKRA